MNEDAYIEEQNHDGDDYALALQNEQMMRNLCPEETRSTL